jgi:hypothetical protein
MTFGCELRLYDLIDCVAFFHPTRAEIKRKSMCSVKLSFTSPPDDALSSIDALIKDMLDQDAEMKRQDKQINLHRMPDRVPDRKQRALLFRMSILRSFDNIRCLPRSIKVVSQNSLGYERTSRR